MIRCQNISRSFRTYKKEPGVVGSIKSFLNRKYTIKDAVKDLNLEIQQGEIVGLLGPNGAGKTTIMKMLSGIIVPTSGQLTVSGEVPFNRSIRFRKNIALVMGQKGQLAWDLPAIDTLQLLRRYYDVSDAEFSERLELLSNVLSVKNLLGVHVRKLSLGERMKMEVLASLLHKPTMLFLDEPTIGLDLIAQQAIREFLLEYHKIFKPTIILTSHYMADVEALCERIVLIVEGKIRFDGSKDEFERSLGSDKLFSFNFESPVAKDHPALRDLTVEWKEEGISADIFIPQDQFRSVISQILTQLPVQDIQSEKAPIERVLKQILTS